MTAPWPLPPRMLSVIAEVDPLRDEGPAYAARLSAAGVQTEIVQFPGAVHGFDILFPHIRLAQRAFAHQVRAPGTPSQNQRTSPHDAPSAGVGGAAHVGNQRQRAVPAV
ncbi:alpha/beta hydrolase fold domain-containing protein [Streptomyces sp. NPDC004647]|uniref:alpha/beta hydrolase fold domain-containing protein n=1 Tax=Streptomyces sp. NPDC004647 TaxID=3154671 RepID=UPI0033BDFBC6